jgi:3-hydroxybutyryl-CoA dehydrogenase
MSIKKIAVIGAGTMGNGIAHVAAQSGYDVVMVDTSDDYLSRGLATITKNFGRMVQKEKITEADSKAALGRIKGSTNLGDCADADLVIEAVFEDRGVKKDLYAKLEGICGPGTLFASNTSTIPITELAGYTKRPTKFIGMHFMNPVPMMKLVEVIRGMDTSDETLGAVVDLSKKLGKEPIEVNDFPGFVSNRILLPMINEAVYAVMEGVAVGSGRPHRPGRLPGHHGGAPRGAGRFEVPAVSLAAQDGGRRTPGAQVRQGVLRLQPVSRVKND